MKKLKYVFDNIELWIATFFFCLMASAVILQLVSRAGRFAIIWTEEVARFSYIWIAFLCMALHEKKQGHFSVTAFTSFLKGRAEAVLNFIVGLICSFVFIYLFYWSIRFLIFSHVIISGALRIPITVATTCLCVGFFLCSIRRLCHTIDYAKQIIKGGK